MNFPEKIYVARRFVSADEVIGYMVIADKEHTKAFQTKKEKVDKWCKGQYGMPSLTIENKPQKGFAVVQKLSIYSKETYFTIRHAEGFEFNISAKNMQDLIMNNNIINGVFQDPLFFNDSLELINENTRTFARMEQQAQKEQERAETIAALKTGSGFQYGGQDYYYCGEVNALCVNKTKDFALVEKSAKYHLIKNVTENAYIINAKMEKRDIKVLASLNVKIDLEDEIQKANEFFQSPVKRRYTTLAEGNEPVLISSKSFKRKDLKVNYEQIDMETLPNSYFNTNVLFMTKETKPVDSTEIAYRVFFGRNVSGGSRGYSYYRYDDYTIVYEGSFEHYCAYPCTINENGIMEMDVDINKHKSFSTWRGYNSPFYPPTKKYQGHDRNGYKDTVPMSSVEKTNKLYIGRYYI